MVCVISPQSWVHRSDPPPRVRCTPDHIHLTANLTDKVGGGVGGGGKMESKREGEWGAREGEEGRERGEEKESGERGRVRRGEKEEKREGGSADEWLK